MSNVKIFNFKSWLILLIILAGMLINSVLVFSQTTYPVIVNTMVEPPYSPYFSDYFSPATNKWKSNIIFNDFSEPSWDVKLRITIESNKIKIQTRPTFIPPTPIRVIPGVPYTVTGSDLSPYFEYSNLILNGITAGQLSQNGRLPEGFYSFCVEILDYRSGTPLSLKSCSNFWIQLNDEPITITPVCGNVVRPNPAQNIVFQWQQSSAVSPNSLGTEYQLVLYEITDPTVNPLNAIQNNKVLKIFESEYLNQTTFLYDMTAPILDIGKRYVYTIQARDIEGKDVFKNKGTSQPCWFYYGFPNDGLISLIQPNNLGSFFISDPVYFKWSSPSKTLSGQVFSYRLKIVEVDSTQTPETAMEFNPAWHEQVTNSTNRLNGYDVLLNKKLKPQTTFAWQITAITDGYEIAKSPVYVFYGPGIIEKFLAGDHEVLVKTTFNQDLNHLNGVGVVRISGDGKTQEVNFSNLRIIKVAGRYVLDYGVITDNLNDTSPIELDPAKKDNRNAYFYPQKFKLDKNHLMLLGNVKWETVHTLTAPYKAIVVSDEAWMNYDVFKLRGNIYLNPNNQFTLLDPYHFKLNLFTSSDFLIDRNKYYIRFKGEVVLPDAITGTDYRQSNVKIPFETDQLFYITSSNVVLENNILPLSNSNLVLAPTSIIIDLSDTESPLKLEERPEWKGVYFPKFAIHFNRDADKFGELIFTNPFTANYELKSSDNYKNWIGADGLNLSITKYFSANEKSTFNKFPANLTLLRLEIEKNSVQNSSLTGSILIPFVSTTDKFTFTAPIMNTGFQHGYLDSLDGTRFKFNPGSEEMEIDLTITRAVFANGDRLDMTLDLDWPGLDVSVDALTGFRAWGNYNIGFLTPNGTMALHNQLNGNLRKTYPVIFDGIGAGSSNGAYAFGLTGKAVLAEDVSGDQGPPSVNMYSTVKNSMLPQTPYVAPSNQAVADNTIPTNSNENSLEDNIDVIKNDLINRLNQSSATATDNSKDIDLTKDFTERESRNYETSELIDSPPAQSRDSTWGSIKFSIDQEKLLDEALAALTIALAQPLTDTIKAKINSKVAILTAKIDKFKDSLNIKVDRRIRILMDTLAARASRKLKRDDFDPTEQINVIADSLAERLSREIRGNISYSIDNNIKFPLIAFVDNTVTGRTNAFIEAQMRAMLLDLLNGQITFKDIVNKFIDDLPILIHGISNDAFGMINMERLNSRVTKIGEDAIGGIKLSEIDQMLLRAINAQASYIVSKQLSKLSSQAVNNLANKIFQNDGNVSASAGLGVKMNFEGLGRNLKEGRIDKIVKLDAVSVALNTKFVAFGGLIYFTPDDPIYGNIWKGGVNLDVKLPKKFSLSGLYVNGRKGDMPYWFCQISGAAGDSSRPGGVMDKKAKPLSNPADLGPILLMGASGRLYHHMTDVPGRPIVPDANTNYGAGVSFVFFDKKTKGTALRLALGAGVEIKNDGNYVIDFEGDAQIANKDPQVLLPDPMAMGGGGIHLNYNSAESHFLGEGWVLIQHEVVCAKGNFLVDMKPDYWLVQVGTRDNLIMITPGCKGWGAAGWFGINPSEINAGLGLSYTLNTDIPINLKLIKVGLYVDAGLAAGVSAVVRYKPSLKLIEAGVWVDIWAKIIAYYETKLKSGSIELVDIYCRGDLVMRFDPPPTTLRGQLRGHIEILCFGIDFDTGFEKTLGKGNSGGE